MAHQHGCAAEHLFRLTIESSGTSSRTLVRSGMWNRLSARWQLPTKPKFLAKLLSLAANSYPLFIGDGRPGVASQYQPPLDLKRSAKP